MKYDCNKTLDCIHELLRICDCYNESYGRCAECPLRDFNCEWPELTQADIDILQKWSDEHPEAPKLTRKEHDFLTSFDGHALNIVRRSSDRLYVVQHSPVDVNTILIDPNSFPFINVGEVWYFTKLLNLEVEE